MCTVTLSYDAKNVKAQQALLTLLSTGLFTQMPTPGEESSVDDPDIDYSDPWLYEDHGDLPPLPEGKESFNLEELRDILISDLNEIYDVKDAI